MTTMTRAEQPGGLATAWSRIWRARRLVERNIMVYRHQWIIIFSGVFEPIFYLLGIGLGIGGIIETVALADGREVSYAAYVAPALLATAAMNGAVFETIFNVFFKLNYAKTYDGVLATPMGITEIALGEMMWALMRGVPSPGRRFLDVHLAWSWRPRRRSRDLGWTASTRSTASGSTSR